jgi:hypothetical protein
MRLTTKLAVPVLVFLMSAAISLSAQTLKQSDGYEHSCTTFARLNPPSVPKGTISYDDFMSNLGNYLDDKGGVVFNHYDAGTNEYYSVPAVSFVLQDFFAVELGSMFSGKRDAVTLSILASECQDMVLEYKDGHKQFIAEITVHLHFRGDAEYIAPEDAPLYIKTYAQEFLDALAHRKRIMVVATPASFNSYSRGGSDGDRIQRLDLGFYIEDYKVLD